MHDRHSAARISLTTEPPPPFPVPYPHHIEGLGAALAGFGASAGMYPGPEIIPPYPHFAGEQSGGGGPAGKPLSVTHVGPCMLRGGAETWLQGLVRFLDPTRVRVVRCLVTDPGLIDPVVCAEMGVPVEVGGREAVRQASHDSDVLLCWGPGELADWLGDCRPRLGVFVAHGEGAWTRYVVARCAPVLDHVIGVSR